MKSGEEERKKSEFGRYFEVGLFQFDHRRRNRTLWDILKLPDKVRGKRMNGDAVHMRGDLMSPESHRIYTRNNQLVQIFIFGVGAVGVQKSKAFT